MPKPAPTTRARGTGVKPAARKTERATPRPPAARRSHKSELQPTPASSLHADLDELVVQADLAAMGGRQAIAEKLLEAQNAWLAARKRLEVAVSDADKVLAALKTMWTDAFSALDAADQAAKRTRSSS